ncbi:hypothetical protein [Dickeya solani]|uniref:hypothetical protein n=1 Tax=Dickeya solani TaxID=1089444 RepID=UPI0011AFCF37|nr:hypothetical protein [Dickeya solani]MBJ2330317.1 hypothetical protein [Dickeya solani]MBJ2339541.1 hypothetical protein [Dickeya solani]MBJ2342257.1 hypothetical protein [Dickeya solani]MBJ2352450.1 hypothetical protein [Dickeya solani]MCZ0785209.1 hypothetical protein [Dickeya solani]
MSENGYASSLRPQQGEAPPTSMIFQGQGRYRHRHCPRLSLRLNLCTSKLEREKEVNNISYDFFGGMSGCGWLATACIGPTDLFSFLTRLVASCRLKFPEQRDT